jgi:hypothetical protein
MPIGVAEERQWSMIFDRFGLEPEDSVCWIALAAPAAAATAADVAEPVSVVFAFALRQISCFEP